MLLTFPPLPVEFLKAENFTEPVSSPFQVKSVCDSLVFIAMEPSTERPVRLKAVTVRSPIVHFSLENIQGTSRLKLGKLGTYERAKKTRPRAGQADNSTLIIASIICWDNRPLGHIPFSLSQNSFVP